MPSTIYEAEFTETVRVMMACFSDTMLIDAYLDTLIALGTESREATFFACEVVRVWRRKPIPALGRVHYNRGPSRMSKTIADWFEDYRRSVIPAVASDIQITETRNGFVAGAFAVLNELRACPPDAIPAALTQLMSEVGRFADAALNTQATVIVSDPQSGYQVRDEEIEQTLRDIGYLLGRKMPENYGFCFLMFTFGNDGSLFYISNAQRADIEKVMREFITRQTH